MEVYFMDKKLSYKLCEDMFDLIEDIKEVYNPNRFFQMLTNSKGDGYSVVLKLAEKDIHYGFTQLCDKRRLDLSVEALIVEKYKDYFLPEVIKKFTRKLKKCGYTPDEERYKKEEVKNKFKFSPYINKIK
jgi:hypothetical protein